MTESTAADDRAVSFEGADWSAFDLAYATALDDMVPAEAERTEGNVALASRSPRGRPGVQRAGAARVAALAGVLAAAAIGCGAPTVATPSATTGPIASTFGVSASVSPSTTESASPEASSTAAPTSPQPTLDMAGLRVEASVTITHAPEAVFGVATESTFANERLDAAAVLSVRYVTSSGTELQRKVAALGDTVVLLPGQQGGDWFTSTMDGLQAEVIVDSVEWFDLGSTEAYAPLSGSTQDCDLDGGLLPLSCTLSNKNPYDIAVLPLLGRTLNRSDGTYVVTDVIQTGKRTTIAADARTRVAIDPTARALIWDWWEDPDQSWIFMWLVAPTQPWMDAS
jgi:hypothetical protein